MKRAWTAALLAAIMILSLTSCAPEADTPNESAAVDSASDTAAATITVTPAPTVPAPNPMEQLNGITAAAVRQVDVYDDSRPAPVMVYSSLDDITAVMKWFTHLSVGEALAATETDAPGDWRYYEFTLFDGRAFKIYFGGDTISADSGQFRYTGPKTPELAKTLWLDVAEDSYAADETVNFSVVNETGGEAVLLFVPVLERATETGWEPLECAESFCGVPDPITDKLTDHEFELSQWFPDAGPGVYRLSLEAYDEDDNPFLISDIFEIK